MITFSKIVLALCVLTSLAFSMQGKELGFSFSWVNGVVRASAASTPQAAPMSGVLLALALLYPHVRQTSYPTEFISVTRRILALLVDYSIILAMIIPAITLSVLAAESIATGSFEWSFERDFARPTDWIVTVAMFAMFGFLFGYFVLHAMLKRQTIGQYLLGFRLEPAPGLSRKPHYWMHFINACSLWSRAIQATIVPWAHNKKYAEPAPELVLVRMK